VMLPALTDQLSALSYQRFWRSARKPIAPKAESRELKA
jgi:hypothetical protein